MPLPLSSIAITEKNKLNTDSVFLLCLKITVPGVAEPIRVVSNTENITWLGETWVSMDFRIEEITEVSSGENPQVSLKVSNVSRAMESYVQEYDVYCKNNGYSEITVDIYVINTKVIAADPNADPEVEHSFILIAPQSTAQWVSFTLGAPNPWTQRFPRNRMLKNQCRYSEFKTDPRCGYTGAETTCDRTLTTCRTYGNSARFGGTPGIGHGGLNLVS